MFMCFLAFLSSTLRPTIRPGRVGTIATPGIVRQRNAVDISQVAGHGRRKDPPGEDEGGSFPGRPAGAAASKAELKASVLRSGPETADSANPGQRPRTLSGPFCHRRRRPAADSGVSASSCDLLDAERLAAAAGAAV